MAEYLKFQKSNCKNCHKCIRHCPVKSIRFSGNQANVIPDECILCGECYVVCPQNAKQIAEERDKVEVLLKGEAPVIASVAPSFTAYFDGAGIGAFSEGLKKLGFFAIEETALGATMVKREYERLTDEGERDIIITSCCPTVNQLVEKYYPQLADCLAPVMTPMQAHCTDIKSRFPDAKTVFIGPCLSKKSEAADEGIDAVLTFREVECMLQEAGVTLELKREQIPNSRARLFPTNGGILATMRSERNPAYTYLSVDGVDACMNMLDDIATGNTHRCFIEMSSCKGSCVGGPVMRKYRSTLLRNTQSVMQYAGSEDFAISSSVPITVHYKGQYSDKRRPSETEITQILNKMGKFKPEDELNCGTCGYNSCRDKAAAIWAGKAEISMCLPYLMEKSERFSNNILDNTPNGIMVVNEYYEIQQINAAAQSMLRINTPSDVLGGPLVRLMDPIDFFNVLENGQFVVNKRDYYPQFDRYLELTIVSDKLSNSLIAFFRDVSEEENARKSKEALSRQTVETADKVVDKQMRIVQEIASLLGETAAETKIALTKLKESIQDE